MIDTLTRRLKREARESATFRGHRLGRFDAGGIAACRDCGKYVAVNARPRPNEIDIGGTAVALSCEEGSAQGD